MTVHPLFPHYIAIAVGSGSVMLLDRRKVGTPVTEITPSSLVKDSIVYKYRPDSVGTQPRKITSVQFNPVGSELLVSYSEDYVYLFSSSLFGTGNSQIIPKPMNSYSPLICRKRSWSNTTRNKPVKTSASHGYQRSPPNEQPPAVKKFRMRGDWSDTGPDARPEEDLEQQRRNRPTQSLMNRMSQMFAQWIDISLNPEENENDEHSRQANASASSSSSSNDSSFQLFESVEHSPQVAEKEDGENATDLVQQYVTVDDNLDSSLTNSTTPSENVLSKDGAQRKKEEMGHCNHSSDCSTQRQATIPTVNIVEDESDSDDDKDDDDDVVKKKKLQVPSGNTYDLGTVKTIQQEVSDNLQPFMIYKGHRNSRTMVSIFFSFPRLRWW